MGRQISSKVSIFRALSCASWLAACNNNRVLLAGAGLLVAGWCLPTSAQATQFKQASAPVFAATVGLESGRVQVAITNVSQQTQVIDISCTPAFATGLNQRLPVLPDPKDPAVLRSYQSGQRGRRTTTKVLSACWRGVTQTWQPGETRRVIVPESRLAAGNHLVSAWVSFELMRYKSHTQPLGAYRERVKLMTPTARLSVPTVVVQR